MKRIAVLSLVTLIFISLSEARDNPTFEFGVIAGEPTGLSLKYWASERNAFDLAIAWAFTEEGRFEVHADYLLHLLFANVSQGILPIYVGGGGALYARDEDFFFGIRIPIGVQYVMENYPVSFFAEVAPSMEIIPETQFVPGGGIGIRLVF